MHISGIPFKEGTLAYSLLMIHQGMDWRGLLPSRCTVTAAYHTTLLEIEWQNAQFGVNGFIKRARTYLTKFLSIKGSNGSAITGNYLNIQGKRYYF